MMSLIDILIKKLVDLDIAKPDDILGCTLEDIIEIQQYQEIIALPNLYKEFLIKMGKGAGNFLVHLKCFYPELLYLKRDMKADLLQPQLTEFKLPDDAFIYMTNQGYEFFYFHTNNDDNDPAVFHYTEGDGSSREIKPIKQWDHLSEYFRSEIENLR